MSNNIYGPPIPTPSIGESRRPLMQRLACEEIDKQSKEMGNKDKCQICETCEIVLRIGIFFDGTKNNKYNTEYEEKQNKEKGYTLPETSYGNSLTNIPKLYNMYPKNGDARLINDENYIYGKFYIDGVGTLEGNYDAEVIGAGLDLGLTSVIEKTKIATDKTYNFARNYVITKHVIRIELDIYGFSRGATSARHFANLIKRLGGLFSYRWFDEGNKFKRTYYKSREFKVINVDTHIKFIGLFDTVATHGITTSSTNIPAITKLPNDIADNFVYQLASIDERRKNFPLTSILHRGIAPITLPEMPKTYISGKFMEKYVYGAHSDIGGGYYPGPEEKVLVDTFQDPDNPHNSTDALKLAKLRNHDPSGEISIKSSYGSFPGRAVVLQHSIVTVKRNNVRADLPSVYLKMMYDKSIEYNVPFNVFMEQYAPPRDLASVPNKLESGDTLTKEEMTAIQNGTHHSETVVSVPNAPTINYKRVIYPNE